MPSVISLVAVADDAAALAPIHVRFDPEVILKPAPEPSAVFCAPVTIRRAWKPTAVHETPDEAPMGPLIAEAPIATQFWPLIPVPALTPRQAALTGLVEVLLETYIALTPSTADAKIPPALK